MKDETIYEECPVYETERFTLRLVEQEDAEDLLLCYSDASAVRLMNPDSCSCDFHFRTLDEMSDQIRGWLGAYQEGAFIRFAIVDRQSGKAVGTIEMFDKTPETGILRLDLCSAYERQDYLRELIEMATDKFHHAYGVKRVLVKAIAEAGERIPALGAYGYYETAVPPGEIWWTWIDGKKRRVPKDEPFCDYFAHEE